MITDKNMQIKIAKTIIDKKLSVREVEKLVREIMRPKRPKAEKVVPEASFKDDLGADSLDLFELVMSFEEEFGVEIPTEELEKMNTVQDVMDYINANK